MIALEIELPVLPGARLIAPPGLATPHLAPVETRVEGGSVRLVADPGSAQHMLCITPNADQVTLRWTYQTGGAAYPETLFQHRASRYTTAATALAKEATEIARSGGLNALANHVAQQFHYGHPDTRYYEGLDEIPQLCALTEGSCVDINAYFIAAARAAGYEAGYVTGCFFPAEKRHWCDDMHCWVVTRENGMVQEWDIAHHLKLDTRDIAPGLNPKPGVRVPLAHSMGLNFPAIGVVDLKLIGEPMWLFPDGRWDAAQTRISLDGYDALAADKTF